MSDSIKSRIRQLVYQLLWEIKDNLGKVRLVERRRDLIASTVIRPALLLIDTEEKEIQRDSAGQTYEFDLYVKILVNPTRTADQVKDELVGLVQAKVEQTDMLAGLGATVVGSEEVPFVTARFTHIEGPFVRFRLRYGRVKGDPWSWASE